jgi:hypothetical protein
MWCAACSGRNLAHAAHYLAHPAQVYTLKTHYSKHRAFIIENDQVPTFYFRKEDALRFELQVLLYERVVNC